MKKFVAANKFTVVAALVLGFVGVLIGMISDSRAPCKDEVEKFLASSTQVKAGVGKIGGLTLRKKTSVNASSSEAAYILYYYLVRGELAKASVVLKADPINCSCMVESIDASN